MRLGGPEALDFYQTVPKANFHFAYINSTRNYIINQVDGLFDNKQTIMLLNKQQFVIHPADQNCSHPYDSDEETRGSTHPVSEYILKKYPKAKFLDLAASILEKNSLLNEDLYFIDFPKIHLADFCAYINNRFNKTEDVALTKLFKFMRSKNVKFPGITIKNPLAKKYLC